MEHLTIPLSRMLFIWSLGLLVCPALGSPVNPICRALENDAQKGQPLGPFPSKYTCRLVQEGMICSKCDIGGDDPSGLSGVGSELDAAPSGFRQNSTIRKDFSQHDTWWICEGHRQRQNVQGIEWVDCDAHFAFRVGVDDVSLDCGQPYNKLAKRVSTQRDKRDRADSEALDALARAAAATNSLRVQGHRTTPIDPSTSRSGSDWEDIRALATEESRQFVRIAQDQACSEHWRVWSSIHQVGLVNGNIFMYDVYPRVGNLFMRLARMMQVSLVLEVALVLNHELFPGFRAAFEPSEILWDVNPLAIKERARNIAQGADLLSLHALEFRDGLLLLTDSRLLLLASKIDILEATVEETAAAFERESARLGDLEHIIPFVIKGSPPPDPCAWNLLLRRSLTTMTNMRIHNPWPTTDGLSVVGNQLVRYIAWHVRTSKGERGQSFDANLHKYIFNQQSSATVFSLFMEATSAGEDECPSIFPGREQNTPIYVSSNSADMAQQCSAHAAEQGVRLGFVDMGLSEEEDSPTAFSEHPTTTTMKAFCDFLYLMDADIIVRTGSYFSGVVAEIKGMNCKEALPGVDMPVDRILVCTSRSC